MIEIFILIALCKAIHPIAIDKGQNPGKWKAFVVCAWFGIELSMGILSGIFGFSVYLAIVMAYPLAYLSYVLLKKRLQGIPDRDEWLDTIGVNTDEAAGSAS